MCGGGGGDPLLNDCCGLTSTKTSYGLLATDLGKGFSCFSLGFFVFVCFVFGFFMFVCFYSVRYYQFHADTLLRAWLLEAWE